MQASSRDYTPATELEISYQNSNSNRLTASQTALSGSSFTRKNQKVKKDFFSRNQEMNNKTTAETFECNDIDLEASNSAIVLAKSKPVKSTLAASKKEITIPSMKAYKTSVWGNASTTAFKC